VQCAADCASRRFVCSDGPEIAPPYQAIGCQLDGVCRPEVCESYLNCYADCRVGCDVPALASTAPADFLVTAARVSILGLGAVPLDLDGDGVGDGELGVELMFFPEYSGTEWRDLERIYAEAFVTGRLLLAARVYPAEPAISGHGLIQLLVARTETDATPLFDGTDRLVLRPEAPRDVHLCGEWQDGRLTTEPGEDAVVVPLPLPLLDAAGTLPLVPLEGARFDGVIDATGLHEVAFGGGVPVSSVAAALIAIVQADEAWVTRLDGCPADFSAIAGCEGLVRGLDECRVDRTITATELRCHLETKGALRSDLAAWRPGGEPRISFTLRLDAVPAVIVE
jgi:hypothetical protein